MKFRLTIKDPDGFSNGLAMAARKSFDGLPLTDDELREAVEMRVQAVQDFLSKWVKYNEYVTLEFDFKEDSARVVPQSEL